MEKLTIGVLSLQGNFQSHINHFLQLQNPSLKVIEVSYMRSYYGDGY